MEGGFENLEKGEISIEQLSAALAEAKRAGATEENFKEDFAEAFELLGAWTDQEGAKARDESAQIAFNIRRAELYQEVGFSDAAMEMLEDTLEYARQMGYEEVAALIEGKING